MKFFEKQKYDEIGILGVKLEKILIVLMVSNFLCLFCVGNFLNVFTSLLGLLILFCGFWGAYRRRERLLRFYYITNVLLITFAVIFFFFFIINAYMNGMDLDGGSGKFFLLRHPLTKSNSSALLPLHAPNNENSIQDNSVLIGSTNAHDWFSVKRSILTGKALEDKGKEHDRHGKHKGKQGNDDKDKGNNKETQMDDIETTNSDSDSNSDSNSDSSSLDHSTSFSFVIVILLFVVTIVLFSLKISSILLACKLSAMLRKRQAECLAHPLPAHRSPSLYPAEKNNTTNETSEAPSVQPQAPPQAPPQQQPQQFVYYVPFSQDQAQTPFGFPSASYHPMHMMQQPHPPVQQQQQPFAPLNPYFSQTNPSMMLWNPFLPSQMQAAQASSSRQASYKEVV